MAHEEDDLVPAQLMPAETWWQIGPNATTNDREMYLDYVSHPMCSEAPACPWRIWWKNGTDDNAFPPSLRDYCFTCAFWYQRKQDDEIYGNGVVDLDESGQMKHYVVDLKRPIKPLSISGGLGFSGRRFKVRFMDERGLVETNDLWFQGVIPEHLHRLFEVNALFEN